MKVSVKTLKGSAFEIEVNPQDRIGDVKRLIETVQGKNAYPADQQMLIHQGKILKDDTTLEENNVAENSFLVIMLSKTKGSSSGTSTTSKEQTNQVNTTVALPAPSAPVPQVPEQPVAPVAAISQTAGYPFGQAASNLVAGSNLEQTIHQILEMGGGTWDRETVVQALRAAFNNPERAIDYLYSGIPESQVPASSQPADPPVQAPEPAQSTASGPNANPLNLFPQVLPNAASSASAGNLDIFRNTPQLQSLLALVQANPQVLQPLQELGKQNPQLLQLIQENQAEFLQLINQPVEGAEEDIQDHLAAGMVQAVEVTPEEEEAILRLQAMGFDHDLVLEVFIACNRDEQMAANYLLDHMHEFEDDAQQP